MFVRILLLTLCLSLTVSCESGNILESYSNNNSDDSLFYSAKNKMNDFDWDGAIQILTEKLSPAYQGRTEVKEVLMHAYGGKCGISFFDFLQGLKNATSTRMFELAMQIFAGRTVDMEACDHSLVALHSISDDPLKRTKQQNLFAAILGLTRMATTLRAKFDTDNGGVGNGQVDASVNACVVSPANHFLSDAEMDRIIAGVGLIFENLAVLGDSLNGGTAGGAFTNAKAFCQTDLPIPTLQQPGDYKSALAGQTWATLLSKPPGYQPTWVDFGLPADFAEPLNCMNTKDAEVTAKMRRLFRRMIASQNMGVGACDITVATFGFDIDTLQASVTMNCCPAPGMVAP